MLLIKKSICRWQNISPQPTRFTSETQPENWNYFKVPKTAKSDVHLTIFSIDNIIQNAMPHVVDYITRP